LFQSFIKCGSREIDKLFDKRLQTLSAKHSEGEPSRHLQKKGPEATASFAFPKIHNWLYIQN